jgi:UDP-N-acetylmuramoyl-L-alanyl-D-glutamate--2,6-diaminopimelate ligase
MTVSEVLSDARLKQPPTPLLAARTVNGLDYDSRRIESGDLFFAFPGARADGRAFSASALERGAVAIVSQSAAPEALEERWIQVEHGREALAMASRKFYNKPDERLGLTGITGTNGKTTTGFLIDSVLRAAGRVTALVGTIEYRMADRILPAVNTTPESLDLIRLLDELERMGGSHATMEVSSHALELRRVYGLRFHTAVFTNLTRDHLDFHGSMDAYFAAKQKLFDGAGGPPRR